ncbi:MAG: tetratricopeptide repeat protein [Burkholderiales bacterium]|nr:tetratricopeptide repeat protein [Burkholderiales bacterium]
MKRDSTPTDDLSLPPEQIELALAHIEQSVPFRASPRHRRLLRHLVERALADDLAALKETVLAIEVFGRPAGRFDPKLDTIVRVEARRLRGRLSAYYGSEGRRSPIRIELPVGSYVPLIASREPPQQGADATRRARDLVERGEHFLRQALSRPSLEQAIERFDLALRESPDYAPALVGMGRAWLNLASAWHVEPAIASAHAAEALRRALQLEPEHAVAHVLLGALQHQFEHDWPAAQRSFQRALALAPQQAFVHSAYGCHLFIHNALDEAERELLLARRLDPQYINTRTHMINLRIAQGRLADAEAEIAAIQDIAPQTMAVATLRGLIALAAGDAQAAIGHYTRACELAADYPGCFIALAGAHAMAGDLERAHALLAQTLQRFAERPISPYVLAIFATRCGRADAAYAQLDRAVAEFDPNVLQIEHDPSFEDLHGDARWGLLLRRIGRRRR